MANKRVSKTATDASASKVSAPSSTAKTTEVVAPAPVAASTQPKKTSKKKEDKKEEIVEEEVVEEEVVEDEDATSEDKKKRTAPTKEGIATSFDELIQMVETVIVSLRDSSNKTKGVKFLRTLNKRIKSLKAQVARIKQRTSTKVVSSSSNGTNSGFLKPVKISSDMAKFTGWDPSELKSRVEVTKYLCNYIRENNLQNPNDKRQIIPDAKLSKLIKYDAKKEAEPLRYYSLQKFLKPHFTKAETA
jgi:upstream activation factor subunit UAF30